MKRKKRMLAALILVLVFLTTACSPQMENNSPVSETALKARQEALMQKSAVIEAEKYRLYENLSRDSIYPEFYASVELQKAEGKSEREAAKNASFKIMERQALCWYAGEQGIELTDSEIKERMKEKLAELKEAENYEKLEALYQQEGISLEDSIRADEHLYRQTCVIDELYFKTQEQYNRGELTDEEVLDWEKYWKGLVQDITKRYQRTEYDATAGKRLRTCEKLIPYNTTNNLDKLKQADTRLYDMFH